MSTEEKMQKLIKDVAEEEAALTPEERKRVGERTERDFQRFLYRWKRRDLIGPVKTQTFYKN